MDGLRGVAALCIVLLHTTIAIPFTVLRGHAYLAVDFFFMLSGFVIGYAYEAKLLGGMSFTRFVQVRLIRLQPMLAVGVALGCIQRAFFTFETGPVGLPALLASAAFALLFLPTPRLHFSTPEHPASAFPLNGPLWSLFFEILSNLLYAPVVRWLTVPRLGALVAAMAIGLALSVFHVGSLGFGFAWDYTLLLGLFRVLCPFGIGLLLFKLIDLGRTPFGGVALTGLAAATVALLLMPVSDGGAYDLMIVLLIFPVMLGAAAKVRDKGRFYGLWSWLGAVSYPLYALHWPLLNIYAAVLKVKALQPAEMTLAAAGGFALSIAFSWLATIAFDNPVRARLNAWMHRRRIAGSVADPRGESPGPLAGAE